MTVGLTTWSELGPPSGEVLVIINSPEDDRLPVDAFFRQLYGWTRSSTVHVIAPLAWRDWVKRQGIPEDRVLLAAAGDGSPYDLATFLTTPEVFRWVTARAVGVIAGTTPHNRYNDQVQEIFERRVAVLLGDGYLLAHTAPYPFVYVFDAPAVVRRLVRGEALLEYRTVCGRVVGDLHARWVSEGSPVVNDDPSFTAEQQELARHLGSDLLAFDEASAIPIQRTMSGQTIAEMLAEVRASLADAGRRLEEGVWTLEHQQRGGSLKTRVRTRLRRLVRRR
jgi:hypothetical protein